MTDGDGWSRFVTTQPAAAGDGAEDGATYPALGDTTDPHAYIPTRPADLDSYADQLERELNLVDVKGKILNDMRFGDWTGKAADGAYVVTARQVSDHRRAATADEHLVAAVRRLAGDTARRVAMVRDAIGEEMAVRQDARDTERAGKRPSEDARQHSLHAQDTLKTAVSGHQKALDDLQRQYLNLAGELPGTQRMLRDPGTEPSVPTGPTPGVTPGVPMPPGVHPPAGPGAPPPISALPPAANTAPAPYSPPGPHTDGPTSSTHTDNTPPSPSTPPANTTPAPPNPSSPSNPPVTDVVIPARVHRPEYDDPPEPRYPGGPGYPGTPPYTGYPPINTGPPAPAPDTTAPRLPRPDVPAPGDSTTPPLPPVGDPAQPGTDGIPPGGPELPSNDHHTPEHPDQPDQPGAGDTQPPLDTAPPPVQRTEGGSYRIVGAMFCAAIVVAAVVFGIRRARALASRGGEPVRNATFTRRIDNATRDQTIYDISAPVIGAEPDENTGRADPPATDPNRDQRPTGPEVLAALHGTTALPAAERASQLLRLDLATTPTLGVCGPGAPHVLRAYLVIALSHGLRVLIPERDIRRLFGDQAPDAIPPNLHITPTLEDALTQLSTATRATSGVRTVLILAAPPAHNAHAEHLADLIHTAGQHINVWTMDDHDAAHRVTTGADCVVTDTHGNTSHLAGAELFNMIRAVALDMISHLPPIPEPDGPQPDTHTTAPGGGASTPAPDTGPAAPPESLTARQGHDTAQRPAQHQAGPAEPATGAPRPVAPHTAPPAVAGPAPAAAPTGTPARPAESTSSAPAPATNPAPPEQPDPVTEPLQIGPAVRTPGPEHTPDQTAPVPLRWRVRVEIMRTPRVICTPEHPDAAEPATPVIVGLPDVRGRCTTRLVLNRHGERRAALIDALWEHTPSNRPAAQLSNLFGRINRRIEKATNGAVTSIIDTTDDGICRLNPALEVDYWEYLDATHPDTPYDSLVDKANAHRKALADYHGELAEDLDAEWLHVYRQNFQQKVIQTALTLAEELRVSHPREASNFLEEALTFASDQECIYQKLIEIHLDENLLDLAKQNCRKLLAALSELGVAPAARTKEIARELGLNPS
ncbi:DNA-binding SARP family transcriptional activator [Pseudonocardia eucalypti]|uniref:hypothetical protein n=1 Tax=Pseudonocardia eucalypti TaxID=648755 RepID=UPI0016122A78|nr:DNA-binding SARP family transcriptional activator [Pseudonocardia eucalypti]MBB6380761.1 DNA-binding SARP family transcriptional activator [Pseudonocardia eucalypti]